MGVLARSVAESYPRWTEPRSTWQTFAACRGMDVGTFFPADGGSYDRAREVCAVCTILERCRRFTDRAERGQPSGMGHGMFASESPAERVERRRGTGSA